MNILIIFATLFLTQYDAVQDLSHQIIRNRPNINRTYATEIAMAVYVHSEKHGVDAKTVVAIYGVESDYRLNIINKASNDYGIGQINSYNVKRLNLDKHRLLTDLDYSVEQSIKIFKWFYKRYGIPDAIMRYNCGTAKSCIKRDSVQEYLKRVNKRM